jgi:hypothetical protein
MSKQELDDAIFRPKRKVKPGTKAGPPQFVSGELPPEEQGEALCYDVQGRWTDNPNKCAAKRVSGKRGVRYFVKWCMEGPDKGHLLNPNSVYYRDGDDVKLEARRGQRRYEFKSVSETAFLSYLSFLETKIYRFCQNAEREILNG